MPNNETDAAAFFALDELPPLWKGRTRAVAIHECWAEPGTPGIYSDKRSP